MRGIEPRDLHERLQFGPQDLSGHLGQPLDPHALVEVATAQQPPTRRGQQIVRVIGPCVDGHEHVGIHESGIAHRIELGVHEHPAERLGQAELARLREGPRPPQRPNEVGVREQVHLVVVHMVVEVVAAHQIGLEGLQALALNTQPAFGIQPDRAQAALEVEDTQIRARVLCIAQQVVEAVDIHLARDHLPQPGRLDRPREDGEQPLTLRVTEHVRQHGSEVTPWVLQEAHPPGLVGGPGGEHIRCLQHVGEGRMTHIVQEGREGDQSQIGIRDLLGVVLLEHATQACRQVMGPDRMGEPRVVGGREDVVARGELPEVAQTLELVRVDETDDVVIERDVPMDLISDDASRHGDASGASGPWTVQSRAAASWVGR